MATFRPRNKIVLFRLTEDEFKSLRSASLANGARSLSELARTEVMSRILADGQAKRIEERIEIVDQMLVDLQAAVQKINRMVGQITKPRMPKDS
jgi:hypothetical protein